MKRIDLIKVEHIVNIGDKCEYKEPNVTEDSMFYVDGEPIGFYLTKMPDKMCKLADLANAEFRSKNVRKSEMVRSTAVMDGYEKNGKRGTETWNYQGKQTITFYQICGDAANFVAKDTINATLSGGAGYFSKQEGPIQQKLVASCKAQGVTDILPSVNKML